MRRKPEVRPNWSDTAQPLFGNSCRCNVCKEDSLKQLMLTLLKDSSYFTSLFGMKSFSQLVGKWDENMEQTFQLLAGPHGHTVLKILEVQFKAKKNVKKSAGSL